MNLEGQWEVAFSETSYPSLPKNVTKGKFLFFDEELSKTTELYYLEPGLYSSIIGIVETKKTLKQEKNNLSDTCIRIKVRRVMQKIEAYMANEESSLASWSTDLRHIFGGDMRND